MTPGCEPYVSPSSAPDEASGDGSAAVAEATPDEGSGAEGSADEGVLDEGRLLDQFEEPVYTHQPTPVDPSEVPELPTPPETGSDGSDEGDDDDDDDELAGTMFGLANHFLVGRHYFADAEGAEFNEIHFLGSIVVFVMRDGSEVAFPADMSGHHPLCADVPACVVLLSPDGTATPFYFSGIYGSPAPFTLITRSECRIAALHRDGPWHMVLEAIAREQGSNLTHESDAAICWNPGLVPYREVPSWWRQRDEDEYRRARARFRAERDAGMTDETLEPPSPDMDYPDPNDAGSGRFGPIGEDGQLLPDGTPGTGGVPGGLVPGMPTPPPGELPPEGMPPE